MYIKLLYLTLLTHFFFYLYFHLSVFLIFFWAVSGIFFFLEGMGVSIYVTCLIYTYNLSIQDSSEKRVNWDTRIITIYSPQCLSPIQQWSLVFHKEFVLTLIKALSMHTVSFLCAFSNFNFAF